MRKLNKDPLIVKNKNKNKNTQILNSKLKRGNSIKTQLCFNLIA